MWTILIVLFYSIVKQKCIYIHVHTTNRCIKCSSIIILKLQLQLAHVISNLLMATEANKKCSLLRKKKTPKWGIELRSPAWQAGILSTILLRMFTIIKLTFLEAKSYEHNNNTVWRILIGLLHSVVKKQCIHVYIYMYILINLQTDVFNVVP